MMRGFLTIAIDQILVARQLRARLAAQDQPPADTARTPAHGRRPPDQALELG